MPILDHPTVMKALDWAWERAAKGLPGQESAAELAKRHMDPDVPLAERLRALVSRHKRRCAAAGFLTNVGGLSLLPVSVPANLASVLFLQLRMVQAMAIVCGHDVTDPKVRAMCGLCLCGAKAAEAAKACGVRLGERLTLRVLERLSAASAERLNRQVGLRLLARFGQSGVLGAGKIVPVVSGLVGAACDAASTAVIGRAAQTAFLPEGEAARRAPNDTA